MKKRKPDHVDGRALAESLYGDCENTKKKIAKPDHKRKARKLLFGEPSLPVKRERCTDE